MYTHVLMISGATIKHRMGQKYQEQVLDVGERSKEGRGEGSVQTRHKRWVLKQSRAELQTSKHKHFLEKRPLICLTTSTKKIG